MIDGKTRVLDSLCEVARKRGMDMSDELRAAIWEAHSEAAAAGGVDGYVTRCAAAAEKVFAEWRGNG